MFDFPNSPSTGQTVTNGSATYRFDGTKWAVAGGAGGLADAPNDANTYGRHANAWSSVAPIASPALTGIPTAPTQTYADSSTALATDAFVQAAVAPVAANANAALNDTGRNLIHNPVYTVAQRGAGPFTSQLYTVDRWFRNVATDTMSISQVALSDAIRAAIGDETAVYCLQNTFTGTASGANSMSQRVEGVRRLSGKTLTLSLWAWATSGTPKLAPSYTQHFGTGGSPSADVSGNIGVTPVLTSNPTRYSFTVAMPSASGKTLGTNSDDYMQIDLWCSAGGASWPQAGGIGQQSGTIQIWGVQLEIGSVATPLAKRDPADDLALCQRFYQLIGFEMRAYFSGSDYIIQTIPFPVTMRATPLISFNVSGSVNVTGAPYADSGTSANSLLLTQQTAAAGTAYVKGTATLSADL